MPSAHTREQRAFIVLRLARWQRRDNIVRDFAVRWPDTACTLDDVDRLDPRTAIIDPDLWTLFRAERERVLDDPDEVPFARRAARILVLSDLAAAYLANNQPNDARAIFRQIVEEQTAAEAEAEPAAGLPAGIAVTRTVVDPVPQP